MPFPADRSLIAAAEEQLGVQLPEPLVERLLACNGGYIRVLGWSAVWKLLPARDTGSRLRGKSTGVNLVSGQRTHRQGYYHPPEGPVILATTSTSSFAGYLVLDGGQLKVWLLDDDRQGYYVDGPEVLWGFRADPPRADGWIPGHAEPPAARDYDELSDDDLFEALRQLRCGQGDAVIDCAARAADVDSELEEVVSLAETRGLIRRLDPARRPSADLEALAACYWDERDADDPKEDPPSGEQVLAVERRLGVTLPSSLLAVLRQPRGSLIEQERSWIPVEHDSMRGYEFDGVDDLEHIEDSRSMNEGWQQPLELVLLEGDGHSWVALDYRGLHPDDDRAPVVWYENDSDTCIQLAPDFDSLLRALREPPPDAQRW